VLRSFAWRASRKAAKLLCVLLAFCHQRRLAWQIAANNHRRGINGCKSANIVGVTDASRGIFSSSRGARHMLRLRHHLAAEHQRFAQWYKHLSNWIILELWNMLIAS